MNTKRNWTQVSLVVMLALTSLSSVAMHASYGPSLEVLADHVCDVGFGDRFTEYIAVTQEDGSGTEIDFSASCVERGTGVDSLTRFEEYQTALALMEQEQILVPDRTGVYSLTQLKEYLAALANAGYTPTFASEADRGEPK